MPTDLTVAKTIAAQLGNNTFVMLGTKKGELVGDARSLSFRIRGCRRVSHIKITLNPLDTYDLEFFQCNNNERKLVETASDIYNDSLLDCIERVTGLAIRMPRIVGYNA